MELWKKEAIRRLRSYDANCRAVENLREEMRQMAFEDFSQELWPEYFKDRRQIRKRMRQIQVVKLQVENALSCLTPQQRMILQMLDIAPAKGNGAKLCQLLDCEIATVYRHRNKALKQFAKAMFGG